jgi:small subunit ribosomal protein S16
MLKIKLSRLGKRKQPFYRIIVTEAKSKRDGSYTDLLGTYNPMVTPKEIKLKIKEYENWVAKGAQPTLTVAGIYKQALKQANK